MKRFFGALIMIIAFTATSSFAQRNWSGNRMFNAGLGFANKGVPVYAGVEFGVHPDITVGGEISYLSYRHNNHRNNIFGFQGLANYHFGRILNMSSEWDFYAGANLGFNVYNKAANEDNNYSNLSLGLQIGGRYYFNNNLALNLELLGGNNIYGGRIGISYMF
ncbi:hypothetical protein [Aureibacter tunicatorum]|uniref:Outer membrane protein beta-barrel domain-containing protein n=1 Tax=Aureibacter tunicatorum TaxID=866807 RepID=A0AAE3XP44_9BACT|nr:hypothetical protein [Aureibacter tunicatorum]MDR6240527.1 hypothetical protein [Aureibacter tunicatorum]BDD06612.1 hypothetical protein AUTU_40950 [Aureibacter tunicatorum]